MTKSKKYYIKPVLDCIFLENLDIIVTSRCGNDWICNGVVPPTPEEFDI